MHEYKIGKDRIKSKMEIDPATQKDSGFYECQADNKYAVERRGFRTDYTLDVYWTLLPSNQTTQTRYQ